MKYTIGCIGCGNMGSALVKALAKVIDGDKIAVCDKHPEKIAPLQETLGVVITTAEEIAKEAKFVMLGVKPQSVANTLSSIQQALLKNHGVVLISMAAAVSIADIKAYLTEGYCDSDLPIGIIRMLPNTPASVGAGVTVYSTAGVSEEEKGEFCRLFSESGLVEEIPEEKIDVAGTLSGCAPAFAYLFAEALADGAVACGLPREKAIRYAAKVLEGAGKLIAENGGHLSDLKDAVCSPGGTTIQGVRALEAGGFRSAAIEAIIAAYEKTLALQN